MANRIVPKGRERPFALIHFDVRAAWFARAGVLFHVGCLLGKA